MRSLLEVAPLALLPLLTITGCATGPHVVPSGGVPQAVAAANGISLMVTDDEWDGSPGDLNEYLIAIPVELTNSGQTEARVSYFDFALVDESGFRYKALNPFQTAISQGERPSGTGDAALAVVYPEEVNPHPVLVAGRGVRIGPPPPARPAPRVYAPHAGGWSHGPTWHPRPAYRSPGYGYRSRPWFGWRSGFEYGAWRGYRVFPGYRAWFGPGFGYYWNDPFFWPPGYAAWVLGWGAFGYPHSPTVPQDVVNMALPEGVLQPGGHVAGYIYFQRARPGTKHLMLTWDMAEARQGTPTGQAQVMLDVLE